MILVSEALNWRGYGKSTWREFMRNANRSGPKLMDWDIASSDKLTYQLHPFYGALVNSTDAYLLFADAVKRDNLRFNWH